MDAKVGDTIVVDSFAVDSSGAGLIGLTATVTLYDESGNLTVSGGVSSPLGGGLYRYTDAGAFDVAGVWVGKVVFTGGSPKDPEVAFEIRVEGDYTAARAAKLDNLDAAISDVPTAAEITDAVIDEPCTKATHNVAHSIGRRIRSLGNAVGGSVDDAAATTTTFVTDLPSDEDDFYNDQLVYFTSGDLEGQVKPILGYAGSTKQIVLAEALTSAPGNGDSFDVLPYHVHPVTQIAQGTWDVSTSDLDTSGSIGELAVNRLGMIASNAFTISSPVADDSEPVVLYRGADYKGAVALTWTGSTWGDLSGATITLTVHDCKSDGSDITASGTGGTNTITVELTASTSTSLMVAPKTYRLTVVSVEGGLTVPRVDTEVQVKTLA